MVGYPLIFSLLPIVNKIICYWRYSMFIVHVHLLLRRVLRAVVHDCTQFITCVVIYGRERMCTVQLYKLCRPCITGVQGSLQLVCV